MNWLKDHVFIATWRVAHPLRNFDLPDGRGAQPLSGFELTGGRSLAVFQGVGGFGIFSAFHSFYRDEFNLDPCFEGVGDSSECTECGISRFLRYARRGSRFRSSFSFLIRTEPSGKTARTSSSPPIASITLRSVLRYMSARRSSLAMAGCLTFSCAASCSCVS